MQHPKPRLVHYPQQIFSTALLLQAIVIPGYIIGLLVAWYYTVFPQPGYATEQFIPLFLGLTISIICSVIGYFMRPIVLQSDRMHMRRGAWTVLWTWLITTSIGAVVLFTSGYPDPFNLDTYSLSRRIVDSMYEAVSGFTATGTTIIPSVEAFPRGLLLFRTITHWYGGVGIATLALLFIRHVRTSRSEIVNTEVDNQVLMHYENEEEVLQDIRTFVTIYASITGVLFVLLLISGALFRSVPYAHWSDNVFDAINYAISTAATGGFGVHDTSVGLPINPDVSPILGGLRNIVSEWIITVFMFMGGVKLTLWYTLVFHRNARPLLRNIEVWTYIGVAVSISTAIYVILQANSMYPTTEETLRYTLFNVATLLSTTGLVNADFTQWPAGAQGLLFALCLTGGMVGSTSGGIKITRLIVVGHYIRHKLSLLIHGNTEQSFVAAGIRYPYTVASIITITVLLYYIIFFFGGIAFMLISNHMVMPDGSSNTIDFTTAFTASIATIGNIGPAVSISQINTGPTGNYFAFSIPAKILMIAMMWAGRVGLLTLLFLFMNRTGEENVKELIQEVDYHEE
jgi:trk system potassium uptake protein TrkH